MDRMRYGSALSGINTGIHTGLLMLCTVVGLQLAWNIVQALVDDYRRRQAARS
jgi:hypothetical protein